MKILTLISVFISITFIARSQSAALLENNLKQHVFYLASDSLHGRRTSTLDELKAADYIITQLKADSLQPMGDNGGWKQAFKYTVARVADINSTVNLKRADDKHMYPLTLHKDYEALFFSGSGNLEGNTINVGYGLELKDSMRNDYAGKDVKGKVVVMKPNSENPDPHSAVNENADAYSKAAKAQENGATAVIFVTSAPVSLIHLKYEASRNLHIPVLVLIHDTVLKDNTYVQAKIEMEDLTKTGYNVIGYINNHATNTVIIGAHYDHLGYGEDGNSLYRGEPAIHNGADDNASGTAAALELARILKLSKKSTNNNYIIALFSGEELGLFGSKYMAHHLPVDSNKINYMLNMDMLGRYRDEKGLEIGGLGTSPVYDNLKVDFEKSGFKIHATQSGMGPSDFTSFYLTGHPVIYFFTGTHADYHKPSDKADKLNYTQEASIIEQLILPVIHTLDGAGKLAYVQTKDYDKQNDVPRFKVRLGIIPDYMFEGSGVRVDGVTPGNPAEKAGLKQGDIIVEMDTRPIDDLQSYMKALSNFKSGQTVMVKVKRGKEEVQSKLTF